MNIKSLRYREYILKMLIAIAGNWQATGCQDEKLEYQFNSWMLKLQDNTGLNYEGATAYLMVQVRKEMAA